MCRVVTLVALTAAVSACGSAGGGAAPGSLIVSAASSLTPVLAPLVETYMRETGARVELNLAASSTLAAQLLAGAPVDLFISADQVQMDRVDAEGLIRAGTRVDLLSNQLVVVAPADTTFEIEAPVGLVELAGRIAVADPAAVPAGVYARTYLESLGLWRRLEHRLVPTRSARAALVTVESGAVDAGIVYRTDALSSDRVRELFAVPVAESPAIVYPAALTVRSHPVSAARLLAYLQGPEAGAVFEAAGFIRTESAR